MVARKSLKAKKPVSKPRQSHGFRSNNSSNDKKQQQQQQRGRAPNSKTEPASVFSSSASSSEAESEIESVDNVNHIDRPQRKKPFPIHHSDDEEKSCSTESSSSNKGNDTTSDEDDSDMSHDDDDDANEDDDNKTDQKADASLFSDQNASWLKPKPKSGAARLDLLESEDEMVAQDDDNVDVHDDENDDDENERHDSSGTGSKDDMHEKDQVGGGDDYGINDDEEELDIEKEARLLDQEIEEAEEEADEEMRLTIRDHTAIYHLPTEEEHARNSNRVVPPSEIRSHIDSILEVLSEFKERREPGRARKEYVDQLGSFIAELYGYIPELIEYFLVMLGPAETVEFVEQSDKPRPLVIRTNTLKTRRKDLAAALIKRGVILDPLASWSKVGLKISDSPVPIGATPEYLSGHYMLQSAASMCSVMALSPEPQERVLDMSAAPGGKTSYLAQLMRNTGVIIANDLKADRQKATVANLHRLGVKNAVACNYDGRKIGTLFKNRFDRVLLDAPCSGLGVISRDPSVKVQRTMADVSKCAHLQKELLLAAIDALKFKGVANGMMVYSTCSVSVAENEEVIQYALTKREIRLVDTGLDFGRPGFTRFQTKRFHPSVALTRRFYPHVHNMDGFFVAKIQKLSDSLKGSVLETNPVFDNVIKEETKTIGKGGEGGDDSEEKPSSSSQRSSKRKYMCTSDDTNKDTKAKNRFVSITPPYLNEKKKTKKLNAKTTKPRRQRSATDA